MPAKRKAAAGRPRRKTAKQQPAQTTAQSASEIKLPQSDPEKKPFVPENLDRTVIAIPLLKILKKEDDELAKNPAQPLEAHRILIDLNLEFPGGRESARKWVTQKIKAIVVQSKGGGAKPLQEIRVKGGSNQQYMFAALTGEVIRKLVRQDNDPSDALKKRIVGAKFPARAIYHIWPDFKIKALIDASIRTVKADAAHASFSAFGADITWAVLDSGIDRSHPHFKLHGNLDLKPPLKHMDFTGGKVVNDDPYGHGTHVAGIIAGELHAEATPQGKGKGIKAYVQQRDEKGNIAYREHPIAAISGMAPKCKLVNMRVLDEEGFGEVSNIIAAIDQIQEWNGYGRRLIIQGVNLSVGHNFEPEWFACGQSPLCVEVNRLVQSGVVVVVAAGNSGYGTLETMSGASVTAGLALTINDPGNAEHAITVGSTHRDMPHVYGVSYFSSKGPTGDGRSKPDLIAPGEKIISCAAGAARAKVRQEKGDCDYREDSGTSMAAPHVSGVIAAFLSARREFIGEAERVKQIFLSTATDLHRERYFQGAGLVDLMRAIQSV